MNANSYLTGIVEQYSILDKERSILLSRIKPLYQEIREWANEYFIGIIPSGSLIKGTAVKGSRLI